LAEKLAFYEKEFNINPLSWGKKKKKKWANNKKHKQEAKLFLCSWET
jgi:hypothetical protein